jgi:hypothetical protein
MGRLSPFGSMTLGTLVVGTLDIVYAMVFWIPRGATVSGIFQSIAAGLLGKASFEGGMRTAILGAALHYFISFAIVVTYWQASKSIPLLIRRPVVAGASYGVLVYIFMQYVVIPLSAITRSRFLLSWVLCSVLVHALLIGVPAAFFARAARAEAS